jgi:cytochrome P450
VRADPSARTLPFVTESLRLNPAVWAILRTPTKAGVMLSAGDTTTRVRRGQLVNVYVRGINRDAAVWDEPMRFDPARHDPDAREPGARAPDAPGAKESRRALLPFGLGPRGCIGQHRALAEMIAVLPALARRGDVVIQGEAAVDAGFAMRVRGGLSGRFVAPVARGRIARQPPAQTRDARA